MKDSDLKREQAKQKVFATGAAVSGAAILAGGTYAAAKGLSGDSVADMDAAEETPIEVTLDDANEPEEESFDFTYSSNGGSPISDSIDSTQYHQAVSYDPQPEPVQQPNFDNIANLPGSYQSADADANVFIYNPEEEPVDADVEQDDAYHPFTFGNDTATLANIATKNTGTGTINEVFDPSGQTSTKAIISDEYSDYTVEAEVECNDFNFDPADMQQDDSTYSDSYDELLF